MASRRIGVIVGVSEFDSREQLLPLPYAANDAARVYQILRDACGFAPEDLHLLISSKPDPLDAQIEPPTRPNILNALQCAVRNATDNDLLVVFFASHGLELSNVPYLLTADSRMNVVKETAIDTNEINEALRSSSAKFVLRVFDACRSPYATARSATGKMTDHFLQSIFTAAKGWATISSCSSGEYSHESGEFEQGVFSYYFCEGITGAAKNAEGNVTLEGLVEYVKISVGNWSKQQSQKQTPHFQSDLSGIVVLSSPGAVTTQIDVATEHPLSQLQAGMRAELAAIAPDVRELEFTSEEGFKDFAHTVAVTTNQIIDSFDDSTITVTNNACKDNTLRHAPCDAWQLLNGAMRDLKLKTEFSNATYATHVEFSGTQVVVPNSSLVIASARFSFFYWLWYVHKCHVNNLQNRFAPKPRHHTGLMTFKVSAGRDMQKVDNAIREIFSRSAESIIDWTKQLNSFVDSRLQPLRDLKSIIE